MRRFYPTDMRETGYDILFFWVAREMMLALEMTGQAPYETVYLHGIIRNEHGQKISKSMEDIEDYDPLNIIERIGADALRYTLLTSSAPGSDMNLDPRRLEGARNFANKIWNAARFVASNLEAPAAGETGLAFRDLSLPDRWILSRLNHLIGEVTELFDSHQYGEAGRRINDFLWSEFCDWYIEATKIRLYGDDDAARATARATLVHVLECGLRVLHPYMPFVTEEIWQHLKAAWPAGGAWPESIMITSWPEVEEAWLDADAEADMSLLMDLIRQIRNARAEFNVTPGRRIAAIVVADGKLPMFEAQRGLLSFLAKVDDEQLTLTRVLDAKPERAVALVGAEGVEAYLPLAGLVDLEQEIERLGKELAEAEHEIRRAEGMLANEDFVSKAPEHVVQRQRDRLAEQQARRARLQERLRTLQG
jgi:valyl-tRNA synthetase